MGAVKAVFRSWDNPRAIVYRRMNDIPGDWGTAVNVQTMVFGNKGETSGTGVAFTRNPSTGEKGIFGEYLINAQGEDCLLYTSYLPGGSRRRPDRLHQRRRQDRYRHPELQLKAAWFR